MTCRINIWGVQCPIFVKLGRNTIRPKDIKKGKHIIALIIFKVLFSKTYPQAMNNKG